MAKIPIITVIGYSDSGKTRCMTGLIASLTRRGYRVASAKHCHEGFQLDVEGKDSWKHKQAGAVAALISNRGQVGVMATMPEPLPLTELCDRYVYNADLLMAEGYSWEPHPKILVTSRARIEEERVGLDESVIALVGDTRRDLSAAQFRFDQLEELAALVEKKYLLPK
ncbi:MAG: molybdopterin-guanine dinucleotide biosynthesis protein B [Blastocatellales bacterium]